MKDTLRERLYSNSVAGKILRCRARIYEWFAVAYPYYKVKLLHPKTAFLVLTPEHNNIGDHGIAKAETEFLSSVGIRTVEITGKQLGVLQRARFLGVLNGSLIIVNGGGFLGTLWFGSELLLRDLIVSNSKARIVLMPNTFYYEQSDWGREELQKSVEIYNAHPNLTIFAREERSYQSMKEIYRNVHLVPDMVLSLNYGNGGQNREGCLLCLRNDVEKTVTPEWEQGLNEITKRHFGQCVDRTDMVAPQDVSVEQRDVIVAQKIEQFQKARLVIADRLHAMIFCAISGTPCIVVSSKSHKVRGTYDWIRELPYIRFADTLEQVDQWIPELKSMDRCIYDNSLLLPYYDELKEILLKEVK